MTSIIIQIISYLQQSRKFSKLNGVDLLILHRQKHAAKHFIRVGDTSERLIRNSHLEHVEGKEERVELRKATGVYLA